MLERKMTPKTEQVLNFYNDFKEEHGRVPDKNEIVKGVKLSLTAVYAKVRNLERRKLI